MFFFQIIKQLWPYVNQFIRELVRDRIQPIIQEKVKKNNMKGFRFETIRLGSVVRYLKLSNHFNF